MLNLSGRTEIAYNSGLLGVHDERFCWLKAPKTAFRQYKSGVGQGGRQTISNPIFHHEISPWSKFETS